MPYATLGQAKEIMTEAVPNLKLDYCNDKNILSLTCLNKFNI